MVLLNDMKIKHLYQGLLHNYKSKLPWKRGVVSRSLGGIFSKIIIED